MLGGFAQNIRGTRGHSEELEAQRTVSVGDRGEAGYVICMALGPTNNENTSALCNNVLG